MTEVTPNLPHLGNFCKYCFMGTLLGSTSFFGLQTVGKRSIGCVFHASLLFCGKGCDLHGRKNIRSISGTSAPESGALTQADGWMSSWVVFPLLAGMEFLMLELWNSFEQSGFYHRFLEACILLDTPFLRLTRVILELLFFFGFGFLVPCAETTIILFN